MTISRQPKDLTERMLIASDRGNLREAQACHHNGADVNCTGAVKAALPLDFDFCIH